MALCTYSILTNNSMKCMICMSTTVGTKGQIVIPKEARDVFDIHPGDHLLILADAEQGMAIPPKDSFEEYFKKVFH